MSYAQLSSCSTSVSSELNASLEGLQKVLLKLEGGVEPQRICIQRDSERAGDDAEVLPVGEVGGPSAGASSTSATMVQAGSCRLSIERPVYQQATIDDVFCTQSRPRQSLSEPFGAADVRCMSCSPGQSVVSLVPAVTWLGKYNWRHDLIKDVISGCTVAVMNIPQGMAYALLGNVPPVVGIYMAIFPVLVYAFLGTSRHVAMGSFAVICLMTGKVVSQHSNAGGVGALSLVAANSTGPMVTDLTQFAPLEVATAVTFMVAMYQLAMYMFRMGIMCSLLSDTLVNGFTAGAAIHVFTSQIKDLLGMKIPKYNGSFQIIYTYIGIFNNLSTINIAAALISFFTVAFLIFDNKVIKPWVSKRSVFPVPVELIAVMMGTIASTFWGLHSKYNLTTVGHISVGLPEFRAPNFQLLPIVALDSFVIALIAYIITMSMALIFAQKMNYEVNPNQELLAQEKAHSLDWYVQFKKEGVAASSLGFLYLQGTGNLLGSYFSCMPFAASLSRSMIQHTVGGRTQLASIINAAILGVVLLSFGPIFEPLPRCILASLIIVALKGVLLQVKDVVRIWRMSVLDGIVWICTYVAVIVIEIDIGLLVGLIISILTILFRGLRPYIYKLSRLPNTDIYVESERYRKVEDISGICIIHYAGGLNFANRGCFRKEIKKIINRWPAKNKLQLKPLNQIKTSKVLPMEMEHEQVQFLVLDLTGMQYVDPSGAGVLQSLASELSESSMSVYLAGASGPVHEVLRRCNIFEAPNILCFPTIHDAVVYAQAKLPKVIHSIRL